MLTILNLASNDTLMPIVIQAILRYALAKCNMAKALREDVDAKFTIYDIDVNDNGIVQLSFHNTLQM